MGVLSDTHGLLRDEARDALANCSLILHAGDIGDPGVLQELEDMAPVVAVRGNTDMSSWSQHLSHTELVEFQGFSFYILHDLFELDLDPQAAKINAVISGHTHRPLVEERNGVLFLNPGSAGPRRGSLPICLARIQVMEGQLQPEIFELVS
ncbi:MAG: metallophosphoesterase family protein [Deltaproteobacteria bacterium]|nr:metallophosphoesterase family protein [Deltaproteobacteria bacterium]